MCCLLMFHVLLFTVLFLSAAIFSCVGDAFSFHTMCVRVHVIEGDMFEE